MREPLPACPCPPTNATPQARLERQRREEALALLEMRKAVEHLQQMEGMLAKQEARVRALTVLPAALSCAGPPLPCRAARPLRSTAGMPLCAPLPARPLRCLVQLEEAAEGIAQKAARQQEAAMTARAMQFMQASEATGADLAVCALPPAGPAAPCGLRAGGHAHVCMRTW